LRQLDEGRSKGGNRPGEFFRSPLVMLGSALRRSPQKDEAVSISQEGP
jgi:hypothetical protein